MLAPSRLTSSPTSPSSTRNCAPRLTKIPNATVDVGADTTRVGGDRQGRRDRRSTRSASGRRRRRSRRRRRHRLASSSQESIIGLAQRLPRLRLLRRRRSRVCWFGRGQDSWPSRASGRDEGGRPTRHHIPDSSAPSRRTSHPLSRSPWNTGFTDGVGGCQQRDAQGCARRSGSSPVHSARPRPIIGGDLHLFNDLATTINKIAGYGYASRQLQRLGDRRRWRELRGLPGANAAAGQTASRRSSGAAHLVQALLPRRLCWPRSPAMSQAICASVAVIKTCSAFGLYKTITSPRPQSGIHWRLWSKPESSKAVAASARPVPPAARAGPVR